MFNKKLDLESDSVPKIDLVVDDKSVGQFGLANMEEAAANTDYSDSEPEQDENLTSNGVPADEPEVVTAPKRSSARIRLSTQAGNLHKRTRYA